MIRANRISKGGAKRSEMDFSRMRRPFQGRPRNYLSYGVVGHYDLNPAFARVEGGRVLVEVTLVPGDEEIVAQLADPGGGDGFAFYMPLRLGMRVVVGMPQGDGDSPVILSTVDDQSWPFPSSVAGVATTLPATPLAEAAPQFAFLRTPDGALLAVETGVDADILISSGASIRLAVPPGEQVLVKGTEMHIGADFAVAPTGPTTGPAGVVVPGVSGAPFVPVPGANLISPGPGLPPVPTVSPITLGPYPADGLVRFKDSVQANQATDPAAIGFLLYVFVYLQALSPVLDTLTVGTWTATLSAALAAAGATIPVTPPTAITSLPASAARSTCAD